MAKKSVATFRGKGKAAFTKVIVPVFNEKTGGYAFKEEIVLAENVKDFIAKHSK